MFLNFEHFSFYDLEKKCWLFGLELGKANKEDPDQTASSVWSGSTLFVYAFEAGNYCLKF